MKTKIKSTSLFLWTCLGFLVFLAARGFFNSETNFTRSSIVLITADSLRPDHLTPYGYARDTTPHLNALAAHGSVFYYVYAQSSHPGPAAATLFTSQLPPTHGVLQGARVLNSTVDPSTPADPYLVQGQQALKEEVQTLTEGLKAAGYATAGFSSSGYLTKDLGFAQGFDRFDDSRCRWGTAQCVSEEALKWLEGNQGAPFFLWIHFNDLMDDSPVTGERHSLEAGMENPFASQDADADKAALSRYDAKLASIDREIGKVARRLKERGQYEDLLLAFTGIHGEELGEHGGWGHGTSVYNEQIHLPLIVKLPRNRYQGTIVEQWVRQADLAPTILEAVEAPPLTGIFGASLIPDIQGIGVQGMEIYVECRADGLTRAVLDRKYKLIARPGGAMEFYNIKKDFREKKNSLEENRVDVDRMSRRLQERFNFK